MAEYEEQERDAKLAAMDVITSHVFFCFCSHLLVVQPRHPLSPNAVSPGGTELEENPFDSEFNDYDEDNDHGLDFSTPQNEADNNTFAVLKSSLTWLDVHDDPSPPRSSARIVQQPSASPASANFPQLSALPPERPADSQQCAPVLTLKE